MDIIIQLLIFLIFFLGSFCFSGIETGFISWNPLKVNHQASQGNSSARWALFLIGHQGRVISSILIGNNICNIGATLIFIDLFEIFRDKLSVNFLPSPESWLLTPMMVLFAEMLPKSLFRTYPFRLTMRFIPVLLISYFVAFPFSWLASILTNLLSRNQSQISQESFLIKAREEMVLIAGEGSRRGTLIESADRYMHSVLNLKDYTAIDMMIKLDELDKRFQTFSSKISVGQIRKNKILNDEVVIIDDDTIYPIGIINLFDIIGVNDHVPIKRFIKSFENIKNTTPILNVYQIAVKSPLRFINITDNFGKIIGVIYKDDLIRAVFSGVRGGFSQD